VRFGLIALRAEPELRWLQKREATLDVENNGCDAKTQLYDSIGERWASELLAGEQLSSLTAEELDGMWEIQQTEPTSRVGWGIVEYPPYDAIPVWYLAMLRGTADEPVFPSRSPKPKILKALFGVREKLRMQLDSDARCLLSEVFDRSAEEFADGS